MRCSMFHGGRIVYFASYCMILVNIVFSCPSSCICKWKSGKQTVECIDKDLLIIPVGIDSTTQVLEFCGNNLKTLQREKFLRMDLINLQRIYLCRCRITSIDDRTFKGLTNLVELDLSGNLLEVVPSETFLDCPSLMRLTLDSNPIKTLRRNAFNHLSFLTTLELSHCEISRMEDGSFQGLLRLEWLKLNGNKLTNMLGCKDLPLSLKGVQLQDNPWECDCHILELHAWLTTFPIPHSVEPICNGPLRLEGRKIKSVPLPELACLPDVSPTTFFLEISEGKNVSLLCQVRAVPEAEISWRFQGQLLQNDSMIAPGVHLLYYIEEGTVEKRSELFIYNTNSDDNGTFICSAENPAGMSQANFTIRVVVKHDPPVPQNELPFEFLLVVMTATGISTILLIVVVILSIIRCRRNARLKKKRNNSKAALSNSTKDNLLQDDDFNDSLKEGGGSSAKLVSHEEETSLYSLRPGEELLKAPSAVVVNQTNSPTSLRRFQLEQNPDLINGTESVGRYLEGDRGGKVAEGVVPCGKGNDCDLYMLASDVHLNPVGLLNPDGARQQFSVNCYRTLPYNRTGKRQTAANPYGRYSREAEFLSRTTPHPASYEHYGHQDVRYTVDGYPAKEDATYSAFESSSPNNTDSAVSTEPCCSKTKIQWPSCVPANLIKIKCVGAQTQTDNSDICPKTITKPLNKTLVKVHETLTESPDEGYEGECLESNNDEC